ncbi:MAG: biotin transporter BioY [Chloroflexota bacterium]|nr:biotin transporter BioY [Chloroflexota bacterium]MDE2969170.1 biotin transporter BioY [Chloroflexota bacterium]
MQAAANPRTLIDAIVPVYRPDDRVYAIARDVAIMVGFAFFVALCAQIAVRLPWTPVPITGQTFAVLVTGGALGAWRGAGSLGIYMLMGSACIPVFAPGAESTAGSWDAHFILPWSGSCGLVWSLSSGGYIVGFILAAGLVGWLAEQGWDRKQWVHLSMFLGNAVLYVPGLLWLNIDAADGDWAKTLEWGLYPFIVGDMMKLFLASLTLPAAWALVARLRGGGER